MTVCPEMSTVYISQTLSGLFASLNKWLGICFSGNLSQLNKSPLEEETTQVFTVNLHPA